MSKRIFQFAITIAPKHVVEWRSQFGTCAHHLGENSDPAKFHGALKIFLLHSNLETIRPSE
jgi:hypothetical protein